MLYAKHGTSDKLSYFNIGNFRKQKRFAGSVIYVYNHFGRSRRQMTGRLFSPRVDIERQGKRNIVFAYAFRKRYFQIHNNSPILCRYSKTKSYLSYKQLQFFHTCLVKSVYVGYAVPVAVGVGNRKHFVLQKAEVVPPVVDGDLFSPAVVSASRNRYPIRLSVILCIFVIIGI